MNNAASEWDQTIQYKKVDNLQSVIEQVKWVSALDQAAAQALVDDLVRCHLGPNFFACDPRWIEQNSTWSLFIECRVPNLARPILAGRVSVDGQTGQINGADEDALLNMQERVQIQVQRQFGQRLAYNADGLILPYQAMKLLFLSALKIGLC